MEKSTKVFAAAIVLLIVVPFAALVVAHILALCEGAYLESFAYHETIFISALTLGLMIVLILPHIINKEQVKQVVRKSVKQEIENYWTKDYQQNMIQFISKSERDYAHTSRMIAYILKHKHNYYWAMAWAGDSVVAYIKRFKEHPNDFQLNKEYFAFSLMIMNISFKKRKEGTFLEENIDLGHNMKPDGNLKNLLSFISFKKRNFNEKSVSELWDKLSKEKELTPEEDEAVKKSMKEINNKIYEGEEITPEEQSINAVKELKRVILRYIKWQCIIYIKMQEYKKLSNVIRLMKEHLDPAFKKDFEDMVKKTLKSFHYVDEDQFISDVVEKVELEEQEKVHRYLENMLKWRLY